VGRRLLGADLAADGVKVIGDHGDQLVDTVGSADQAGSDHHVDDGHDERLGRAGGRQRHQQRAKGAGAGQCNDGAGHQPADEGDARRLRLVVLQGVALLADRALGLGGSCGVGGRP
jgi:hypothetical protein